MILPTLFITFIGDQLIRAKKANPLRCSICTFTGSLRAAPRCINSLQLPPNDALSFVFIKLLLAHKLILHTNAAQEQLFTITVVLCVSCLVQCRNHLKTKYESLCRRYSPLPIVIVKLLAELTERKRTIRRPFLRGGRN